VYLLRGWWVSGWETVHEERDMGRNERTVKVMHMKTFSSHFEISSYLQINVFIVCSENIEEPK
jgi:hypothetical protein